MIPNDFGKCTDIRWICFFWCFLHWSEQMHHHVPLYADNKKANIATTNVNKAVVYICRC